MLTEVIRLWVRNKGLHYLWHSRQHEHQHICICSLWLQVLWGDTAHCGCGCATVGEHWVGESTLFMAGSKQDWSLSWGRVCLILLSSQLYENPEKMSRLKNGPVVSLGTPSKSCKSERIPRKTVFSNNRIFSISILFKKG